MKYPLVAIAILAPLLILVVWPSNAPPLAPEVPREVLHLTTTDGIRIHAVYYHGLGKTVGGGPLPAVVVGHGFTGTHVYLEPPVILPLTRSGFDVIAVDFRGHGGSGGAMPSLGQSPGNRTSPGGFALDLEAAVAFLDSRPGVSSGNPEKYYFVGHSMGGGAVLSYAFAHPERVRAIAPLSPGLLDDYISWADRNYPPNLLLVQGDKDPVTPASRAEQFFRRTANGSAEPMKVTGDFANGTARCFALIPGMGHGEDEYPGIWAKSIIGWFTKGDPALGPGGANLQPTLSNTGAGLLLALLLSLPISAVVASVAKAKPQEPEKTIGVLPGLVVLLVVHLVALVTLGLLLLLAFPVVLAGFIVGTAAGGGLLTALYLKRRGIIASFRAPFESASRPLLGIITGGIPALLLIGVAMITLSIPLGVASMLELPGRFVAFVLSFGLLLLPMAYVERAVGAFAGRLPGGKAGSPILAGLVLVAARLIPFVILMIVFPPAILAFAIAVPLLGWSAAVTPFISSRGGPMAGATFGALVISWAAASLLPVAWAF